MGALSAGIVGGGSLIGSKIIGAPKEGENSPFLKRAALGGAIAGTGMGIAGAVLAKKNPFVKGAIASLAKEWRPAAAMQKAGVIKASAIGALAGGGYGAMTGSDEGSQVDTIQSLRKDRQKTARRFARVGTLTQFASQLVSSENGIPLTGKLAKDRFIKKLRDEDLNKRDANILRTGAMGAIAGSLLGGKAGLAKRALLGAGAGALGVIGARAITSQTRDVYGERSRGGKQAEKFLPIGAAATLAAAGIKKKLTGKFFSSAVTAAIQLSNRLEKLNTL